MNKKQAIDFIKLKLEDSIFKPYIKSLTELTSFANEQTINLYEEDLYQFMYGYNISLSKLIENIKDNDNAVSILETIIYTMVNTEIKTIEEFLPFSKFKKEYEIIKDINFEKDFDSLKIDYNSLNINNFSIYNTLLEQLDRSFGHYDYCRFNRLDKIIEDYYKAYLFLKNFKYYSIHGKYALELNELKNSFYETRGKYNSNTPALKDMYDYFLVDLSKPELLKDINSAFKDRFDRKLDYEEIGYSPSSFYNEEEDSEDILNVFKESSYYSPSYSYYRFSVERTTPTFYFLKRESLVFARQDSDGNFKDNLNDYFRQSFKLRKSHLEDIKFNIGDSVILKNYYFELESDFDKYSKDLFKLGHIDSLSKEENYNLSDYFLKVLSSKFVENVNDINLSYEEDIQKLTKEFQNILIPTSEDLLNWLNIYTDNSIRNNDLKDLIEVDKREAIGDKIIELKKLLNESDEIFLIANNFIKECSEIELTEREVKALKYILSLYYNKKSKTIDFTFKLRKPLDEDNEYDRFAEVENRYIKLKILKTKFELSDFDI